MTASVLQERVTDSNGSGASLSLAFVSNNIAGSAIHVAATWGNNTTTDFTSVTDTNNTYGAVVNAINDSTSTQSCGQCRSVNIAAGANTVQANFTNSPTFRGIWIREIGGVTTAPNDGNNGQFQSAPGTGTDAVSSLTATNSVQPVFMSAVSMINGATGSPTTGTGFSTGTTGWGFGGTNAGSSEHERFTDTNAKAATFTASPVGSRTMTVMAMFDEAATAAGDAIGPANIAQSAGRFIGWTV